MQENEATAVAESTQQPVGLTAPASQTVVSCPRQKPCDSSCPKEPTEAEYKRLRRRSPSRQIRKSFNSTSPLKCEACGKITPTLAADHIVALKTISKMPGFACLSKADQEAVANSPGNFAGLCRSCNSSKCAKDWYQWRGVKDRYEFMPRVRNSFLARRNTQVKELKAAIAGKDCPKRAATPTGPS
jgi:hypothetical protein